MVRMVCAVELAERLERAIGDGVSLLALTIDYLALLAEVLRRRPSPPVNDDAAHAMFELVARGWTIVDRDDPAQR